MSNTGLIILAHGSRSEWEVKESLEKITKEVKIWLAPDVKVEWSALQFNHPDLRESANALIKQGAGKIVIMPYFLFKGKHPTEDIPAAINLLKQTYPEIKFVLTDTLGVDENLIHLVIKRIKETAPELLFRHNFLTSPISSQNIEAQSMEIIEKLLPPLSCSENEKQVIKRIVHAAGDPQVASLVKVHSQAISAGVTAIRQGKPIFTDVKMVAVGINRQLAEKYGCSVRCALDEMERENFSYSENVTRSASAIYHLGARLNNSIVAIGNAPTALFSLINLIDEKEVLPALVVGMPVGFIEAKESKKELVKRDVPCIVVEGTRGGSAMAVATVNALLKLADRDSK